MAKFASALHATAAACLLAFAGCADSSKESPLFAMSARAGHDKSIKVTGQLPPDSHPQHAGNEAAWDETRQGPQIERVVDDPAPHRPEGQTDSPSRAIATTRTKPGPPPMSTLGIRAPGPAMNADQAHMASLSSGAALSASSSLETPTTDYSAPPAEPQTAAPAHLASAPSPAKPPLATVRFSGQSAAISDGDRIMLDRLAKTLTNVKQISMQTYSDESEEGQRLAVLRGLMVRTYLIERGVTSRIDISTFAATKDLDQGAVVLVGMN